LIFVPEKMTKEFLFSPKSLFFLPSFLRPPCPCLVSEGEGEHPLTHRSKADTQNGPRKGKEKKSNKKASRSNDTREKKQARGKGGGRFSVFGFCFVFFLERKLAAAHNSNCPFLHQKSLPSGLFGYLWPLIESIKANKHFLFNPGKSLRGSVWFCLNPKTPRSAKETSHERKCAEVILSQGVQSMLKHTGVEEKAM
jgi:hypothetical protein